MKTALRIVTLGAAAALSACADTGARPAPIDVTRYHLGAQLAAGSVEVTPRTAYAGVSPEDGLYTGAVADALARLGYPTAPTAGGSPHYVALVGYSRTSRGFVRKRPPVTIGLGGGSYGGNVGVGGGASFGIGGGRAEIFATELSVQIKRRSDNNVVWEGRAITEALSGTPAGQPAATAQRLASALFQGFPGESGVTITVK